MKNRVFLTLIIVIGSTFSSLSENSIDTSLYNKKWFEQKSFIMAQAPTKEAYTFFENGAKYFLKKNDTANYLMCIAELASIEHRKGMFHKSFDLLWNAMPIASNASDKLPLIKIQYMIGVLYSVYGKDSIAMIHIKEGLHIAQKHAPYDKKYAEKLSSCYLNIATHYVAMENYDTAIKYLDSCYYADKSGNRLYYVDAFYGHIYERMNEYDKAQEYFKGIIPYFEKRGDGFLASANNLIGDLKKSLNETDSAIYYYKKSIDIIDSLQTRTVLKPSVMEKIALLNFEKKNFKQAFIYMQKSKQLSDSLFNTQSQQNKLLFEIKNRYREDLEEKESQLKIQNNLLSLSNKARFRLRLLISIILLLAIISIYVYRLTARMKTMAYQKKINDEKNDAILEIKNKELTANALQIIEKEQAVKELLEELNIKSPDSYKILHRKYKQSNKKIWEDFHLRFTNTNEKFYDQLLQSHPDLTPTDLKHCALVKLNFDSKEMSHLLGISVNSVHMARSRIRKKIGLNREDNLSNYLNKI